MQNKETKKTALARKQQGPLLYIFISIFIVVLLIVGFLLLKQQVNHVDYMNVKIGNTNYKLEIAETNATREKGLSERDGLAPNTGMLFDFKEYGNWNMWMYRMRFDIDIAWLDKAGKVIEIKKDAKPGEYPETYKASEQSWYVIEVLAGTFESRNVKVGDTIAL